jgi:hypothetical protein
VKERIYKYLLEAGRGVAATEILADVLNIRSPNAQSSDNVLAGLLGEDPRFLFKKGLWHLRSSPAEPARFDFDQAVVLHLQSPQHSETLQGLRGAIRCAGGRLQEFTSLASTDTFSRLLSLIEDNFLIVWSNRELRLWNALLRSKGLEAWQGDKLYLRDLASRVLQRMPSKLQPEDLASRLGLSPPDEERPREVTEYLNTCRLLLLELIPAEFRRTPEALRDWMEGPGTAIDFSRFTFGPDFLRRLPGASGVYIMKDREGAVIYVGKSRNLKRRVSSYFATRSLHHPKIARIHEKLRSIEILPTDNEIEALLLEMELIKTFRPAINLQTEIHEGRAGRHEGRNLLLFVVDAEQEGVKIYLLRSGIFAGRQSASLGNPPSKRLREKLNSLFFTQGKRRKQRGSTLEKEIVSRWFAANQRRLNYLDVDEMEGFEAMLERLQHYLCDPDKLTRKVYYR